MIIVVEVSDKKVGVVFVRTLVEEVPVQYLCDGGTSQYFTGWKRSRFWQDTILAKQ